MPAVLTSLTDHLPMLLGSSMREWMLLRGDVLIPAVFIFCFGACVGSFLNVVIYRLPAGQSISTPPSRCLTCGARLRFFRENLPILGWLLVRGKCRSCGVPISIQYMMVELMMAVLFTALFWVLYAVHPSTPWWGEIGGAWWYSNGPWRTFPMFIALSFMVAGLVAMTIIDARTFTIPIQIPRFTTAIACVAAVTQGLMPLRSMVSQTWPVPGIGWSAGFIAMGGMAGVMVTWALLQSRRLRYSFADYADFLPKPPANHIATAATGTGDAPPTSLDRVTAFELLFALPALAAIISIGWVGLFGAIGVFVATGLVLGLLSKALDSGESPPAGPDSGEALAVDYPHARREMRLELLAVLPILAGGLLGFAAATLFKVNLSPPAWFQGLGTAFGGYLVAGGLVWAIRILGTLGFGREAMGMGDVHLMGAVGAVLGWFDPILIFFAAPFFGLTWAMSSIVLTSVFKRIQREIPYGPHLALATVLVMLCRPGIANLWQTWMPNVPRPIPGLVP